MTNRRVKTRMKADRLRALMEARAMSQQDLSDATGISKQQIWRYANELSEPTISAVIKIATALETTVGYLVGESNKKTEFLTADEIRLIDAYRLMSMTPDERRWLTAFRKNDPALIADLLAAFMARLSEQLKERGDISGGEDEQNRRLMS